MKALITGVAGFAGSHLTGLLLDHGFEVTGVSYPGFPLHRITSHLSKIDLFQADILSPQEMEEVFRISQPDRVYHLAAVSSVRQSWANRRQTMDTNVMGTMNVLEAARQMPQSPRVLLVSTSEVYGIVPEEDQPVLEQYPMLPTSPYATSKAAQELMGYQYSAGEGVHTVIVRAFNHTGPGQEEGFVCSSFARQIARAEQGLCEPVIEVGNLEARRDFSDVRDMVGAYHAALETGRSGGLYNICSGQAHSIEELLKILLGMSQTPMKVSPSPELMRPVDIPLILGSNRRFADEVGWEPGIPIEKTLSDLLDYWREQV
jgi:GDP-4-dehydro-6-deoxy-D-mannose reductase